MSLDPGNLGSVTTGPSLQAFAHKAQDLGNKVCEKAGREYAKVEKSHPKLIEGAKKILPYALAILSIFLRPISTAIGFVVGFIFAKQVDGLVDKVRDAYNRSGNLGKAGIGIGCGVLYLLPVVGGLATGAVFGSKVSKMIPNKSFAS